MDKDLDEQHRLLNIQENYFANLVELGKFFQNSGYPQKAADIIKRGIENAGKATTNSVEAIMSLLD